MAETAAVADIDRRSGFCRRTSIFHSKRNPIPLPANHSLDITTFISSQPHHGKTAFIDAATGRRLSFSDLWTAVYSIADCLSDIGVRKGHVILLLSPNSIFFPVVCLSVMSIGAIITTTNPINTPREIAKQIADSQPILAFTTPELVPKLTESSPSLPIVLIDSGGGVNSGGKATIAASLTEMMSRKPSAGRVKERVNIDDTAALLYSSGTTGESKGVVSSHRNLITMVQTLIGRSKSEGGEDRFICTVPMFHVFGLSMFATSTLASGSTVIILSKFELHDMISAVERYRATTIPVVPPILIAMINGADRIKAEHDISSVKTIYCGGAPLGKEVIEGFVERYPTVDIRQGYGLTESTAIGASTNTMEESRRYGAAGLITSGMEAKIVNPVTGEALPVNKTGELWLRGACVMKGYFNNPEATSNTLDSEGWLRTGDLCYIDDDGFIFVVDRLKELIKYKGYQVPPAELEALLLTCPQVSDVVVIPFPDEEAGQVPMAYVVRKAAVSLSESDVMKFIAKQVAPYKRIRRVAFVSSIPKNPSGKILRKDLIKLATSKF